MNPIAETSVGREASSRESKPRRRIPVLSGRSWLLALMALLSLRAPGTSAFHLDMVATHGGRALRSRTPASKRAVTSSSAPSRRRTVLAPPLPSPPVGAGGVTSSLISQLAVVALKRRLADQASVNFDLSGSSSDLLLRGTVGPVTVRGRGWSSRLGLTCRAIEATVRRCHLDMGSVVGRRKLVLTTPAEGDALIAMDGEDFANFIKHPLMKPPSLPSGESFRFLKEQVSIDTGNGGAVIFHSEYMGQQWKCVLRRGEQGAGKGAVVSVVRANDEGAPGCETSVQLAEVLSEFFNEMVFELDGTFLSFKDMMVTAKGDSPSVLLALSIRVKKFPSAGLAF